MVHYSLQDLIYCSLLMIYCQCFTRIYCCVFSLACEDARIRVWTIPGGGLTHTLTEPEFFLIGNLSYTPSHIAHLTHYTLSHIAHPHITHLHTIHTPHTTHMIVHRTVLYRLLSLLSLLSSSPLPSPSYLYPPFSSLPLSPFSFPSSPLYPPLSILSLPSPPLSFSPPLPSPSLHSLPTRSPGKAQPPCLPPSGHLSPCLSRLRWQASRLEP